jgi:hypothetical protein
VRLPAQHRASSIAWPGTASPAMPRGTLPGLCFPRAEEGVGCLLSAVDVVVVLGLEEFEPLPELLVHLDGTHNMPNELHCDPRSRLASQAKVSRLTRRFLRPAMCVQRQREPAAAVERVAGVRACWMRTSSSTRLARSS